MTSPTFKITGPDDDGYVWLDATLESGDQLMLNLGTKEEVEQLFKNKLGEWDYEEEL